jgi:hypothetical protein
VQPPRVGKCSSPASTGAGVLRDEVACVSEISRLSWASFWENKCVGEDDVWNYAEVGEDYDWDGVCRP